jgi:hypothetical protein
VGAAIARTGQLGRGIEHEAQRAAQRGCLRARAVRPPAAETHGRRMRACRSMGGKTRPSTPQRLLWVCVAARREHCREWTSEWHGATPRPGGYRKHCVGSCTRGSPCFLNLATRQRWVSSFLVTYGVNCTRIVIFSVLTRCCRIVGQFRFARRTRGVFFDHPHHSLVEFGLTHLCLCICTCTYTYRGAYACTCVYMHMYMCGCICIYIGTHAWVHAHTRTYTHTVIEQKPRALLFYGSAWSTSIFTTPEASALTSS